MLYFGTTARKQQANVRHKSSIISLDSRAQRRGYDHLLTKGRQSDNMYLGLRGPNGALIFFADRNIKWLKNLTSRDDAEVAAAADNLYAQRHAAGIETLYDDCPDQAAGVKFNDVNLLGLSVRLVVSPRNLRGDVVELRGRVDANAILRRWTVSSTCCGCG